MMSAPQLRTSKCIGPSHVKIPSASEQKDSTIAPYMTKTHELTSAPNDRFIVKPSTIFYHHDTFTCTI